MKYAIISDIHGNLCAFNAVLAKTRELGVDKYLFLGDVVGYNARPLECLDLLRSLNPLACVKGNHDDYVSNGEETIGFNPAAAAAVEWTRTQLGESDMEWLAHLPYDVIYNVPEFGRVQLVHATPDSPRGWGYIFDRYSAQTALQCQKCTLCFIGHTHVPLAFDKYESTITGGRFDVIKIEPNHKYLINIGSIGQPRDGDPRASFAVLDTSTSSVSLYRGEYDVFITQRENLAARLPSRLAERLAIGR